MEIKTRKTGSSLLIKPSGELTVYSAGELRQCLIEKEAKYAEITIDLSRVKRIDTAGFQLLLAAKREADSGKKSFFISDPSPDVLRLFAVYRQNLEGWEKRNR